MQKKSESVVFKFWNDEPFSKAGRAAIYILSSTLPRRLIVFHKSGSLVDLSRSLTRYPAQERVRRIGSGAPTRLGGPTAAHRPRTQQDSSGCFRDATASSRWLMGRFVSGSSTWVRVFVRCCSRRRILCTIKSQGQGSHKGAHDVQI